MTQFMERRIGRFVFGLVFLTATAAEGAPLNVLLILVDDLKPALGCYGDKLAKTPNMDRLAASGMRFDLAYCSQAVCAPSRFALLLGSHPTSTGLYGLGSRLRQIVPDAVTMPQYFATFGYRTESLGKVFHIGHGNYGDPESFSAAHFPAKVVEYVEPISTDGGQLTREEAYFENQKLHAVGSLPRGMAWEAPDVPDEAYADGRVASEAVHRLHAAKQRRASDGTPFFMAVGFARPHLPFCAPKKYWDRFDPDQLPDPAVSAPPRDAPAMAGKTNGELANYRPVPKDGVVSNELRRRLIHGYYASVSFVDAQIGKLLDELRRLELDHETIVVLWGDHGFHLGDHGYWTKHTNYEQANHIPLVIVAPGVTAPHTATRQLAQSTDLFPTLAELCGLPLPSARGRPSPGDGKSRRKPPGDPPAVPQPIDGRSLVPVLRDPLKRVRDHAFHCFPRAKLGRAIRTERYRLVEWKHVGQPADSAELELYEYETDPHETRNLAAQQPQIVAQLRSILAKYPDAIDPHRQPPAAKPTAKHAATQPRPNVVIVLVDDFGWGDPSCYGNTLVKTPHFDRLAREGVRFTQGYVAAPICSPSRCGIITGQFPARWKITSFLQTRAGNAACQMADYLDPAAPSLPRVLQAAGYATAHIGKWHLGGGRDVVDPPKFAAYGYDLGLGTYESPEPAAALGLKTVPWKSQDPLEPQQVPRHQRSQWMVDQTLDFVRNSAGRPCFVNLWLDDTHTPFIPSDEQMNAVRTKGEGELKTRYKGVLAALDQQIGRLLEGLRNTNTLVLLLGDNGASPPLERERSGSLRGQKLSLYEGGIRVPMMAWWPNHARPGVVNDRTVIASIDFLPTLISIIGAKVPPKYQPDGEDLSAAIRGETPRRTTSLFWEYGRNPTSFSYPQDKYHRSPNVAVRDGDWKLLVNADGSRVELYDLAADPNETNNLVAKHSREAERLLAMALKWRRSLP